MTVPIFSSDSGTGTDTGAGPEGECIYCHHQLVYARPGNPPYDAVTDMAEFYRRPNVWRDYSLIDTPLVYGKFCPFAPPHPLGQFAIHALPPPGVL